MQNDHCKMKNSKFEIVNFPLLIVLFLILFLLTGCGAKHHIAVERRMLPPEKKEEVKVREKNLQGIMENLKPFKKVEEEADKIEKSIKSTEEKRREIDKA